MPKITAVKVYDIRFPTSLTQDGSDAMNKDGDYSAAYVVLETSDPALSGYGFTFTIGRGNDLCAEASRQRGKALVGVDVTGLSDNLGSVYRLLKSDSQLRWLGPEKGVVHLAMAAVMNAVWDLVARYENKPLWKLVCDMTTDQLIDVIDFQYITDALTPTEAKAMLESSTPDRAARIKVIEESGYPCYTTSAGWLGYSDEKLRYLLGEAMSQGYRHVKLKVGANLEEDIRRLTIAREVIGWDVKLMIDANQIWDVDQAIEWMSHLAKFEPFWIEEPTSPDDVLGHAKIREAVSPIGVASGEHGMNRVLFKQMFQAGALDFCQLDSARLASINEILGVYLMAKKFNVPVCPHAGGVGLCELVQHLSIIDYVLISGTLENRVSEYVDHLHEHFVDPCIVENGAYTIPTQAGYSAQIHDQSVADYSFPDGNYWSRLPL
jgi:L-fuconate dehydratase